MTSLFGRLGRRLHARRPHLDARSIVQQKMAQRDAAVSESEWEALCDAALGLSVAEARRWYAACAQMTTDGRAPRRHPFRGVKDFDANRFVAIFVSNGRLMETLADAIDEPDVATRKARAASTRRAARLGAERQRRDSADEARASHTRLALRDAAARAYAVHGDALRARYPHIRWHDAAATPEPAWGALRLSSLSVGERLAAWHAVRTAPPRVRDRVAPYVAARAPAP
jgi:hypothetical protein